MSTPIADTAADTHQLDLLENIQKRVLWLAMRMVHEANHVRPNPSGEKIGGHQASSASMVTLMTALYFHYLRAGDLVSVKPHASPVFHAIQYLLGQLPKEYLPTLRAFGGLQAYPSRTKDPDRVDFSTGSVGLGAVAPSFAALSHQYAQSHFADVPDRRFVSLLGDAELDEGNIWEALMDDTLGDLGKVLWIVDLNRQSLDRVVPGIKAGRIQRMFEESNWQVLEAKYGRKLERLFALPNGDRLRRRIDSMPNEAYQALLQLPGAALRRAFTEIDGHADPVLVELLAAVTDADLPDVIGNLAGHDLHTLLEVMDEVDDTRPTILFAYTIKGWQLPFAGHPLNHSMLLNEDQIDDLRRRLDIPGDDEWASFAEDSHEARFCRATADKLYGGKRRPANGLSSAQIPQTLAAPGSPQQSTQQAFGSIMLTLSRSDELAKRIVTVSPDVSTSTNLAGWVIKMGMYGREARQLPKESGAQWTVSPRGQHVELGISEMNLFMALGVFGLSQELLGEQLIPIGTVYDPFVCRGLDAFIYGLYSGAKFIAVGTPSGITLAPEGGAHQSTVTPSLGMELPNLDYYEPCYAQELAWILLESLRNCVDRENGRAAYLRLSTKMIEQSPFRAALERIGEDTLHTQVLKGGYRLIDWRAAGQDVRRRYLIQIVTTGAMAAEAIRAAQALHNDGIAANVIHCPGPRRLYERWRAGDDLTWLVPEGEQRAPVITVHDGASHCLAWVGSAFGSSVTALGVDHFGQSGRREDVYRAYGVDSESILEQAYAILQRRSVL